MLSKITLATAVLKANTGADAIKKAPIVQHDTGIRCLRIGDLSNNRDYSEWGFTNVEDKYYENFRLQQDDIFVARTGNTIGVNTIIKSPSLKSVFNNGMIRLRIDKDHFYPMYIFYIVSSKQMQNYIQSIAYGTSTQPNMKINDLLRYEFVKIDLQSQKKIAHILSTLDDKIELNRKMNQTLEEMAQALFKSWFVDFDPVHARATCRSEADLEAAATKLGISKEVLELFPSEFVESEMGMIPLGWEWKNFGDVITPKKGKVITKKTVTEGSIPVVAGGLSPAYYHNVSNAKSPVITVSASGANAGFVNLYTQDIWVSDCSYINSNMTDYVYTTYILLSLKQSEITRMQQGAAQPHIYPSDLMRLVIAMPQINFWSKFEKLIEPMFQEIAINEREIETLKRTRDTLLPKLLSGEIEV